MAEWIHIDEQEPEQGQAVYYWFGFWDRVSAGFFKVSDEEGFEGMQIFFGEKGFLGDDVTWWMPREELPEGVTFTPAPPTAEQKARCKYHPVVEEG